MSIDTNKSAKDPLLDVTTFFNYHNRPVGRVECDGFNRGVCEKNVGCVALVDTGRGTAEQIADLHIGLCDKAIELSGTAALALMVEPPVPVAGE